MPRRKWLQNLLKMRSWEPQENALRMKKKVERRSDKIPDAKYPRKVERWPDRIPDVRYPEKMERRAGKIPDVRYSGKVERRPDRIPDVKHPGGMSAEKNSRCETSGWNGGAAEFRM